MTAIEEVVKYFRDELHLMYVRSQKLIQGRLKNEKNFFDGAK